jgi:ABC-type phosphate transport system substrate-binding protein
VLLFVVGSLVCLLFVAIIVVICCCHSNDPAASYPQAHQQLRHDDQEQSHSGSLYLAGSETALAFGQQL